MSTLTKSCLHGAREALTTGTETLKPYAHKYSPKRYTQAQLFACLVLKVFFKKDYRGLATHRAEHAELRAALGPKVVPPFTTLPKASRRLLRLPVARRLFTTTVRRFLGRRQRVPRAAFDSTGLDCGRRSSYYVRRRGGTERRWQAVLYRRFAKLARSRDCSSHLLLAVGAGRGPRVDGDRFVPLVGATLEQVRRGAVRADAG
jgi:hypothetical protein